MPDLCEYEVIRARNIERNNARLRSLGLISATEEQASNAAAWGKEVPKSSSRARENDDDAAYEDEEESPRRRKRSSKKKRKRTEPLSPSRKSARLQGLEPDGTTATSPPLTVEQRHEDRQRRVMECREVRQRAALRMAELGAEAAAKENPTATYQHCLMRVRTMSHKALQNRVKAIERAAGKHCVVKMAIFKSCLQDEDEWELAELASQALERLKALQSPPEE